MTRAAHATVVGLTPIAPRPPAKRPAPVPSRILARVIDIVVDEVWHAGRGTPRERARLVRDELRYQLQFQRRRDVQTLTTRVLASRELVITTTIDGAAFERRYPTAPRDGAL
jgi:hypothetical protein